VSHNADLTHIEGLIQYVEKQDDALLCDNAKKTSISSKASV